MSNKFLGIKKSSYEAIRSEIKTGDIFLAAGNYSISRIIEHFSQSIFSHVGFVVTWNSRVLLLESVEDDGVRVVPLSQYVNDYENSGEPYDGRLFLARYDTDFGEEQANKLLGKAADLLNKKYDKDEIAKILARVTIGLGKHGDNNAYICSEFVDVCFKEIGIIFPRTTQGFIFPEHIASDDNVKAICEITGY